MPIDGRRRRMRRPRTCLRGRGSIEPRTAERRLLDDDPQLARVEVGVLALLNAPAKQHGNAYCDTPPPRLAASDSDEPLGTPSSVPHCRSRSRSTLINCFVRHHPSQQPPAPPRKNAVSNQCQGIIGAPLEIWKSRRRREMAASAHRGTRPRTCRRESVAPA